MRRQLLPSLLMTIALVVVLGGVYPLAVTAVAKVAFSSKADGSLLKVKGRVVGSSLLGQGFVDARGNPIARYFQPRPSAAGDGYDPLKSSATNLGPSAAKLIGRCEPVPATDQAGHPKLDAIGRPVYETNPDGSQACDPNTVPQRVEAYRQLNGLATGTLVPVDAVTASGSGLDPHISVANADLQVDRVAQARHLSPDSVRKAVRRHTEGRPFGILGEKVVNVLELNVDLDRRSQ